jgi:hypothetical protein
MRTRVIRRKTNRRHMTGDHGRTARRATLLVRAMDEILGTHNVTFGVRRHAYLAPGAGDLGQSLVDILHVDVRDDASLACDRQVGREVADDVAGGVPEAVAAVLSRPAEHGAVKDRGERGVRGGDTQV